MSSNSCHKAASSPATSSKDTHGHSLGKNCPSDVIGALLRTGDATGATGAVTHSLDGSALADSGGWRTGLS